MKKSTTWTAWWSKRDQLALAIGRGDQNVRLASRLTAGFSTSTVDEAAEKPKTPRCTGLFINSLDVDEEMARVLVSEGFTTLEEVAYVPAGRNYGRRRAGRRNRQ